MGDYVLEENKSVLLRPVYKKTDSDDYIFYNRKLYFILVITVSQSVIFIIAGAGTWMVGPDYTDDIGGIQSEKRGLLTIPTSGWQYEDEDKWNGDDDTLKFIYN